MGQDSSIQSMSDEDLRRKISSMLHNRNLGYPFDRRKCDEFMDEAMKRGLEI